jgi:imidazole glycerol phosphate synthase subunit HisF
MDAKRFIPMVWIRGGQAAEPLAAGGWRSLGWPAEVAGRLELEGADSILFREAEPSGAASPWVQDVASALFIPFAVEAPFGSLGALGAVLEAGADQVLLDAQAPLLLEAAQRFGRMRVAAAAALVRAGGDWRIGAEAGPEVLAWMEQMRWQGAGAVYLDRVAGHPAADELLQGVARSLLSVVVHGSGAPAEAAALLLHGAEGLAFPAQATATAALKAALASSGLTLRL